MRERGRQGVALAFGTVLRDARKAAGLSQEELALEAGLERVFISLLERGQRSPSLTVVLQLARTLNVPANQLVAEVERKTARKRA
jgi:transcriptional regulator with XRE-family HTH domain